MFNFARKSFNRAIVMAQCVANPIYDAAFKFLMEDDRCVKVLLSALLKKEVVDVKVRPHEYTEKAEKRISIYRVDFGATVREADGSEHLVLVELQKTWRPTELLRFRKYLGLQYEDKRNVNDETGVPIPIVSIYILGHTVGDLTEPVVYVKRQYLDYDSQEIKDGVPCTFVESLTHDSIIVQIPYLKDNVRNHLERILDVFNQKYVTDESDRFVYIEGRDFSDSDSQLIISRLAFAAADPDIRYAMNVEEEVLGELEGLDTKVQIAQEKLAKTEAQLAERDTQLAERDTQLAERDTQLAEQDSIIHATARALKQSGMAELEIAALTKLTIDEISAL